MLDRMVCGEVARKHHIQLRDAEGRLRFEECLTRDGFDGPYTILYHRERPQTQQLAPAEHGWAAPVAASPGPLAKRHFRSQSLPRRGGAPVDARVPMLFGDDVVISVAFPDRPDPVYVTLGDSDELLYVHEGGGLLRCPLGDVGFSQGDYVFVPRGLPFRLLPTDGAQCWLSMEFSAGFGLLKQFRNDTGQLKMDAPYCHRDFKRPLFVGPMDEGIRRGVVRRDQRFHGFSYAGSPLDVVGWDGAVYPWAFPILAFQPRTGQVHLPPTYHGTFSARGALVCSFVPRLVDYHPEAIPCPYPHSSPHCDEFIFYCAGNFTSRKGVAPGSISYHPYGIPHGPHPGAYEASIGTTRTEELAVMIDTFRPIQPTAAAATVEDATYMASFV